MKDIYKIDTNGIYIDVYKIDIEKNSYYNGVEWLEIDFNYVEVQPPNVKVVKWEIDKWVTIEDYPVETQQPKEPTTEELQTEYNIDLDYRISLIEMGLI